MIKQHPMPERPQYPEEDNFSDRDNCGETCVIFSFALFGIIGAALGALATYFIMR